MSVVKHLKPPNWDVEKPSSTTLFVSTEAKIDVIIREVSALFDEDSSAIWALFVYRQCKKKVKWECPLCPEGTSFGKTRSLLSLKLRTLRHLKTHHGDVHVYFGAHLESEWTLLEREFGTSFDALQTVPKYVKRAEAHRSSTNFLTHLDDPRLVELFGAEAFCEICCDGVASLDHLRKHSELENKLSFSEFFQCEEVSIDQYPFPHPLLAYVSICSEQQTTSASASDGFTWHCRAPSCVNTQPSSFPTIVALKVDALRHFEEFHGGLFNEVLLDNEWSILHAEAGLTDIDLRTRKTSNQLSLHPDSLNREANGIHELTVDFRKHLHPVRRMYGVKNVFQKEKKLWEQNKVDLDVSHSKSTVVEGVDIVYHDQQEQKKAKRKGKRKKMKEWNSHREKDYNKKTEEKIEVEEKKDDYPTSENVELDEEGKERISIDEEETRVQETEKEQVTVPIEKNAKERKEVYREMKGEEFEDDLEGNKKECIWNQMNKEQNIESSKHTVMQVPEKKDIHGTASSLLQKLPIRVADSNSQDEEIERKYREEDFENTVDFGADSLKEVTVTTMAECEDITVNSPIGARKVEKHVSWAPLSSTGTSEDSEQSQSVKTFAVISNVPMSPPSENNFGTVPSSSNSGLMQKQRQIKIAESRMNASSSSSQSEIIEDLLSYRKEGDLQFATKAIKYLVRKLSNEEWKLDVLRRALRSKGQSPTECLAIRRSRERGRITIGGRVGLPRVIYMGIWRWPNVTWSELRKLECCTTSDNKVTCINPYHYERVSPSEACYLPSVSKLQSYQQENTNLDPEIVKKAIQYLVKKLNDAKLVDMLLDVLKSEGKSHNQCFTIQQYTKGTIYVMGTQILPHLFFSRIWRWPNVTKEELEKMECCSTFDDQLTCVNPYHYERVSCHPSVLLELQRYQKEGVDPEFAIKAIQYLVKELKTTKRIDALLDVLNSEGKSQSQCFTIRQRSTRKIDVCGKKISSRLLFTRIWRWPNVLKEEMRTLERCTTSDDQLTCINPYHYERVQYPEASPIVLELQNYQQEGTDSELSNKAIHYLVEKLGNEKEVDALLNVLKSHGKDDIGCVTIPCTSRRRICISGKTAHLDLLYTGIWRWHGITREELRRLPCCPLSQRGPLLCVNPYHYERVVKKKTSAEVCQNRRRTRKGNRETSTTVSHQSSFPTKEIAERSIWSDDEDSEQSEEKGESVAEKGDGARRKEKETTGSKQNQNTTSGLVTVQEEVRFARSLSDTQNCEAKEEEKETGEIEKRESRENEEEGERETAEENIEDIVADKGMCSIERMEVENDPEELEDDLFILSGSSSPRDPNIRVLTIDSDSEDVYSEVEGYSDYISSGSSSPHDPNIRVLTIDSDSDDVYPDVEGYSASECGSPSPIAANIRSMVINSYSQSDGVFADAEGDDYGSQSPISPDSPIVFESDSDEYIDVVGDSDDDRVNANYASLVVKEQEKSGKVDETEKKHQKMEIDSPEPSRKRPRKDNSPIHRTEKDISVREYGAGESGEKERTPSENTSVCVSVSVPCSSVLVPDGLVVRKISNLDSWLARGGSRKVPPAPKPELVKVEDTPHRVVKGPSVNVDQKNSEIRKPIDISHQSPQSDQQETPCPLCSFRGSPIDTRQHYKREHVEKRECREEGVKRRRPESTDDEKERRDS